MTRSIAAALLLCAAVPSSALALEPYKGGDNILALSLGGTSTSNEYDWSTAGGRKERAGDPGGALGVQYFRVLQGAPFAGLGIDLNLAGLKEHESDDAVPNRRSASSFGSFIVMPMVRFSRPGGRFRPYGFAGLGLHSTKLKLELTPINGTTWPGGGTDKRAITDGKAAGGAISFGGGLDAFLNDSFFLGTELRVNYLGKANYGVTDAGRALNYGEADTDLSNASLTLRAGMKF